MTRLLDHVVGWRRRLAGRRPRQDAADRATDAVALRLESVLRGAKAYVFVQDRELRYTWARGPDGADAVAPMLGRTDHEIFSSPDGDCVVALKRRVIETGAAEDCEVSFVMPESRALFALHVEPIFGPQRRVVGITSVAVDVSPARSRESEQRKVTEKLEAALLRYETALRRSNVTVFTQDRHLRYTSVSSPIFGLAIEDIVGRTDDEILPAESRAAMIALKRDALETGEPRDGELSVANGSTQRCYDLHIEPLSDVTGATVGLTCAAVDITEREEGEAHLRMLMRELTHRSKNMLAVIQAMARQTARHAGSTEGFLDQFGARLQALATAHDLLVQESWHGVSLHELARTQLGFCADGAGPQVVIDGPGILLKPEVAQDLGLALHELATNAAKYGALSVPAGRVSITWSRLPQAEGHGVEIVWSESGGPAVPPPARRGFGSLVIERNLARALDADVALAFAADGVRCRMVIPETRLSLGR
jgi:PAS domain S-box-containing protein